MPKPFTGPVVVTTDDVPGFRKGTIVDPNHGRAALLLAAEDYGVILEHWDRLAPLAEVEGPANV